MRLVVALVTAALLAGCASNEYSKVPEPTGEWVAANPLSLMAPPPLPPAPLPVGTFRGNRGAVQAYWASRSAAQ